MAAKDPLGNVGLIQYDAEDRVTQVTDALNQISTVSYDGNGNALSVTLPSKAVISETYDARNRPITRTDALHQSESWTYDGMNHVLSYTDRKGQATLYSYDALNRRSLVSYADGSTVQPGYDAANRLTSLSDSSNGQLSWVYDGLDRITSAVTPQASIGYTYDAAGRRTSMTAAAQAIVNYSYDNANRLTSLTQGSETVTFGYDAANRRTSLTLPNAVSMIYGYDVANELTGINYMSPTNTTLGALVYGYDLDGHRISKTGSFATDVLPASTTAAGAFDLNNRQTQFNGTTQTYDANGNLTSNGVDTFVWNARNQLVQINAGNTTQFSYTYDALGRRTSKSVAGATAPTTYLYDGMNAVQEAVGNVTNPILTGLGIDERFARNDVNGRTDLLTDALNSTIALTDPTGKIAQQYSYDPYGNVTQSDTTTGFTNPYLYTGREADSTGLYYYRARYYSPLMGRFISEDPIGFNGGQNNFYAYVGNDPLDYIDQTGLVVRVVTGDPVVAQQLMDAYAYLNAHSPTARSIDTDLENSSTVYKIEPTNDMDNDEYCRTGDEIGCEGHAHTVFVDVCDYPKLPTTAGMQPVPLPVLIGHELGHAWGYDDNVSSTDPLGDNVRMVENPIRQDLGYPLRTRY